MMSKFGEILPESSRRAIHLLKRKRLGSEYEDQDGVEETNKFDEEMRPPSPNSLPEIRDATILSPPFDFPPYFCTLRDYRRLIRRALMDSLEMYSSLKELPDDLQDLSYIHPKKTIKKLLLKTGSEEDVQYEATGLMMYDFAGGCSLYCASPFYALRFSRDPQDGRRVTRGRDACNPEYDYNRRVDEVQQYIKLWEHYDKTLPARRLSDARDLDFGILREMKLHLLRPLDVLECKEDVLHLRRVHANKQLPRFCRFLRDKEKSHPQYIHDRDSVWKIAQSELGKIDVETFKQFMDVICPFGKACPQENHGEALMKLELWCTRMEKRGPPCLVEYFKLKLAKALELGLIKYDEKGILVDNFVVSEWKI